MGAGRHGGFGNTKGSNKQSKSNESDRFYGKPGQVKRSGYKETHIGRDGRAFKEIHHTDHGFPKYHTNPHEHTIKWDNKGNPIFGK